MAVRTRTTRQNATALQWLRALGFGMLVLAALSAMPFYPKALVPLLALGCAALAIFVPGIAVLAVVVSLTLPMFSANVAVGLAFVVIGLAASQYLGQRKAAPFFIVAFAFLASSVNAAWAAAILAGFALGSGEGAAAALLACLAVQGAGFVFGKESIGLLATGGLEPGLATFAEAAAGSVRVAGETYSALGFEWFAPAFSQLDFGGIMDKVTDIRDLPLFIAQPIVWAGVAALTGTLTRHTNDPLRRLMSFVSVVVGTLAIAVASVGLTSVMEGPVAAGDMAPGAAASLFICLLYVAVAEYVFPPKLIEMRSGAPSLHAEDADVDELLRVISSAEDALASKHTIDAAILITDMKSFSHITELDGSVLTAKTIQRHRDLLLPVISRHGGSGKSTGGDGLLASFERPADAVTAAVEMQQELSRFNAEHPGDRPTFIRIGMASGEVVVDKRGRPFIGDALNRAARIMDLADGGQIFASYGVMNATAAPPPNVDHGSWNVKNIKEPMGVREVLWRPGQEASPPKRDRGPTSGAESEDVTPPPATEDTPEEDS